jgi:hypothetical protein
MLMAAVNNEHPLHAGGSFHVLTKPIGSDLQPGLQILLLSRKTKALPRGDVES